MTVPRVRIRTSNGNTGVVTPGGTGVAAIIAPSEKGPSNIAAGYSGGRQALADYGGGILAEVADYVMAQSGRSTILVSTTAATAGAYGAITDSGAGTSVITAGASSPLDDFAVVITFVTGGTVGAAGITYRVSLDGGATTSGLLALGTATELGIPGSGVSFELGAGTVLAGQTVSCTTTGPLVTAADLPAALEALRVTASPWEVVLLAGCIATRAVVQLVDTWLAGIEAQGLYKCAIVNARLRQPGESDADYTAAMAAEYGAASTDRVVVCADGADMTSELTGRTQPRATAIYVTARAMAIDLSVDPAEVDLGAIPNASILDIRNNPRYHNEDTVPGLDDIRLTTLRTFPRRQGAFVTNANVLSATGSDFVYLQHVRVMNRASEITFEILTSKLSKGVRKQRKADPVTGRVFILEEDAQLIDSQVNAALEAELASQVTAVQFALSRTDDLGSNQGAKVTGALGIESKAYIKEFDITREFVRTIAVAA